MKCFVGLDVSSTKLDVCIMLNDITRLYHVFN